VGLELKLEGLYCPGCLKINDFDYIGMKLHKNKIDMSYYYNCRGCHHTATRVHIYSFDAKWKELLVKKRKNELG
jgi:hypothetical protein